MLLPGILWLSCYCRVFCGYHVIAGYFVVIILLPGILWLSCYCQVFCGYHVIAGDFVVIMLLPGILWLSCYCRVFCGYHVIAGYFVVIMLLPVICSISNSSCYQGWCYWFDMLIGGDEQSFNEWGNIRERERESQSNYDQSSNQLAKGTMREHYNHYPMPHRGGEISSRLYRK